jgi:hypothetical protein
VGFRFIQSERALAALANSSALIAVEGRPRHALLAQQENFDDTMPVVGSVLGDYRLDLLTDTGLVAEPFGALMLVAFDVPADRADEVARWYDDEHIMLLMRADGWLRARRFNVVNHTGKRWTSLAFHELRDVSVMDSPERAIARSTPWRAQLEREGWFVQAGRWIYLPD